MSPAPDDPRGAGVMGFVRASAATTLLYLSGFVLPVGGPLLMLLTPQPGLRLHQRSGMRSLAGLVVLVAVVVGALAGIGAVAAYLLTFALVTLLLPMLLEREWSI